MSDDALQERVQALEDDNARLRRLLERHGSTAGLRHQIRNTLSMVRDVIRHTAERSEGAEDYAAHLEARLDAVLRIQNTIANRWSDTVSLETIVTDELLAHAVWEGERLAISGPKVGLQVPAAGALALAVHELTVNAIKFGALSVPDGRLAVSWTLAERADGASWLSIDWIESGVHGLPPAPPHRGFGSDVVERALHYQLGGEGELVFAPGGLRCSIRLPLSPWIGELERQADDGAPPMRPAAG